MQSDREKKRVLRLARLKSVCFFLNEGTPFEVEISQMSCCLHLRWKTGRYQIFPNILEMQFHYLLHLFNL